MPQRYIIIPGWQKQTSSTETSLPVPLLNHPFSQQNLNLCWFMPFLRKKGHSESTFPLSIVLIAPNFSCAFECTPRLCSAKKSNKYRKKYQIPYPYRSLISGVFSACIVLIKTASMGLSRWKKTSSQDFFHSFLFILMLWRPAFYNLQACIHSFIPVTWLHFYSLVLV